jgi:DNA primase
VDPVKNIFNCFGNCKSGGNVLDFVSKMENVSVREAALLLKNRYALEEGEKTNTTGRGDRKKHDTEPISKSREVKPVNPPLNFELKTLIPSHPFFTEHNISPSTVEYFGLGYCSRGILKDRIAIPIHNAQGQLIAYCGRAVDDEQKKDGGKYKLPKNFVKSAVLYNLNRQRENEDSFILVESFLSVFHLHQAGLGNALALMGSSLSEIQEALIVDCLGSRGKVMLMFDADESGQACTEDSLARLSRKLFVKALDLSPLAKKPHNLTLDQINELLA